MATQQAIGPSAQINPIFLAQSRLRRRRFDDAIDICTDLLAKNPLDQAAWYLKVRAITLRNWIDDTELEEEGAHPCSASFESFSSVVPAQCK